MIAEIDTFPCVSDNVFCPWVLVSAAIDKLLKVVDVERGDNLGVGQVGCDTAWDAYLVYIQIRITFQSGIRQLVSI